MPITLNAFPLEASNQEQEIQACAIPYDKDRYDALKADESEPYTIRRVGDDILIFSPNGEYPVRGKIKTFDLAKNYELFCFLAKDGVKRHLSSMGRQVSGFFPIELLSSKKEDNLLVPIIGADYPFQVVVKYKLDTQIIKGVPCLVIDCSTCREVNETCRYFLSKGFNLIDRYVVVEQIDGYKKLLGYVSAVNGDQLSVFGLDGSEHKIASSEAYLEASIKNFDDYIQHTHGSQKEDVVERIRIAISTFNGGENKNNRINLLKRYFQSNGIELVDGTLIGIKDANNIQGMCGNLERPIFVFNDNGEANWAEKGFTQYGPYTKRTFDRNDPSVCVICSKHDKGIVEQFIRRFLKGMPNSKYFRSGLEGKFSIGTSRVEVFTTDSDDVDGYKAAIDRSLKQKVEEGERWDLALVQVRQSFKKLNVIDNPYYWGKSLFFLHQVPVQDFTIELLDQSEYSLGYSLNNMALACYAKMGGVPWLLKSSPTISHELVVGIGSANIGNGRGNNQRIMGITTVFSGDGSYIVSSTSKAVAPDAYCDALSTILDETIAKIRKRMNWQKGDTIRLVFHASVKKFNKDEIQAVRSVIDKYRDYHVEYAFLKISENHGLHMFDAATASKDKGRFAPPRGKFLNLSKYETLVYLIGQSQLKQVSDGHPRGLLLNIHRDSTFKDIKYLTTQLYNFSSHSWRSYFPNPMPVTISYSDLIARNLGWLNQLPGWSDSIMIGKIGQSQWFL
ncbi:argonaute/piwi family protein [Nitrosomonas marina]|uniref:Protein argonaute n=1 Tax=Nitrosomonas marina TaxID=917 RepID=A0A1H8HV69_9PROT|nr:Piwi domain-containing protein [Nitrosomonas marina]SEN59588.1 Piwi domain-containing protein [Nitrosomonas marina]